MKFYNITLHDNNFIRLIDYVVKEKKILATFICVNANRQLIQRNCYQLPDMCLKRKQVLVSRPAPRDLSSETSAATTTQVTQIPGEVSLVLNG